VSADTAHGREAPESSEREALEAPATPRGSEVDGTDLPEVPEPPATGDADVDAALVRLAAAAGGTPEQQVGAFDAVHRTLQDRLADVEG
jgi:hypothetical protein